MKNVYQTTKKFFLVPSKSFILRAIETNTEEKVKSNLIIWKKSFIKNL